MPARAGQKHTRYEGIGGAVPGVISGEVNPLGVAKLIAHEVEIGVACTPKSHLIGSRHKLKYLYCGTVLPFHTQAASCRDLIQASVPLLW